MARSRKRRKKGTGSRFPSRSSCMNEEPFCPGSDKKTTVRWFLSVSAQDAQVFDRVVDVDEDDDDHQSDEQFVDGLLIDLFVDRPSADAAQDAAGDHADQQHDGDLGKVGGEQRASDAGDL